MAPRKTAERTRRLRIDADLLDRLRAYYRVTETTSDHQIVGDLLRDHEDRIVGNLLRRMQDAGAIEPRHVAAGYSVRATRGGLVIEIAGRNFIHSTEHFGMCWSTKVPAGTDHEFAVPCRMLLAETGGKVVMRLGDNDRDLVIKMKPGEQLPFLVRSISKETEADVVGFG